MSRKPSKKPKPKDSPTVTVATKQRAAIGQLESAILLWFNEADPISILILASHAHDCYHALGKKIGKPSWHQEFTDRMPPSFRERAKYIQDFAKHGFMDLNESAQFDTTYAEGLMLVSLDCHAQIFGKATPLMMLYWIRMLTERPSWTQPSKLPQAHQQIVVQSGIIDDVAQGSPKECLQRFQPLFETAWLFNQLGFQTP